MRWIRGTGGQSLVELALSLPLLVFILLGGADLARAYALQMAVQNGARAGAEAVAIDVAPTGALAVARALDEMGRTPGMDAGSGTDCSGVPYRCITVSFKQADGLLDCIDPPTVVTPCFATVRVQYTFYTIVPWPLIPNVAHFDRSTAMRTIKAPSP